LDLTRIRDASVGGTLAREMARLNDEQASWRKAMSATEAITKQFRDLAVGSAFSQVADQMKALQWPATALAERYKDLVSPGAAVGSAFRAWEESERTRLEQMRKMFDPMAALRTSVLGDSGTQKLIKDLVEQSSGVGSIAKLLAQQAEASRERMKDLIGPDSGVQHYFRDFERINRQWTVPSEVVGIVGSLKGIHEQFGRVTLPTIDWGSAAALATALGSEGIQHQLALLGIESDGSMQQSATTPEKGILSRKQNEVATLLSLLLGILFFIYQEYSNRLQQASTEAFQKQATATLQAQANQIQSLTLLIEQALVQAAQTPDERLVVRGRPATVRSKPRHGAGVEGQLMPNEVVREISRDGKWIEVEYYHWLHEEYRTGWVLKKYLERVPANYPNRPGGAGR
jgi:hypothetical protein